MKGTPLKPLRAGAAIKLNHPPEHRNRVFCIYFQLNHEVCRKVFVHNNCWCNERISLHNRVLFECPMPTPQRVAQCKTLARLISDWLPRNIETEDWIMNYHGAKRRKYQQARQDLATNPIRRSDSYIAAFIKAEKIFELKDPRMIQARSVRYNCVLGDYLKPIEHQLYNIKGTGRLRKYLPPSRLIAKGCNMERRANLIRQKMQRFNRPLVVSLDASRFDAHVTTMLEVEHLIYKRYWRSPELQRILAWQVYNRGRTSNGIRYKCKYGRMSGDMNTALGNCIISIVVLANIMRRLHMRPHRWDMLCDGDDVLLFVDQSSRDILDKLPQLYLEHGFKIKVENITSDFNKVRFCQTFPCESVMGPKMVSDPTRTLSRSLVGVKHWSEPKFVPKYLALIGYCELALNMGIPVLQEFALTIMSWGSVLPKSVHRTGRVIKALREERQHEIAPLPISTEARIAFEDATGLTPEEQRAIEGALRAQQRHAPKGKAECTTDSPPAWARRALQTIRTAAAAQAAEHSKRFESTGPLAQKLGS